MRSFFKFFLIVLSSVSLPASAQQYDLWQWTTLSVDKKLNSRFSASFDEEVRWYENISQFNLSYTNVGASYKVSKIFKVAVVYRFLQKGQSDGSISFRHRFYTDLSLKNKFGIFALGYRCRLQTQIRDVNSSSDGTVPESYWRNKFDIKFDFNKPLVPYIAAEFRYQFGNDRLKEANYLFNRGRYYVGLDYKLSPKSSVGTYYMMQWEYNVKNPGRYSVLGLTYGLSL